MHEKSNHSEDLDYDVPVSRPTRNVKKLQAKALFDNEQDHPDELAFKKGDILTVIEQDTKGLKGWWLCSLRNDKGLCPGNRLRIINSYDSGCFSLSPTSSPCPSLGASTATLNSSICSAEIYDNAIYTGENQSPHLISTSQNNLNNQSQLLRNQGSRSSWHVNSSKVTTPRSAGDVYSSRNAPKQHFPAYPPNSFHSEHKLKSQSNNHNESIMSASPLSSATSECKTGFEIYDIPKPATPVKFDAPRIVNRPNNTTQLKQSIRFDNMRGACATPIQEETSDAYDVPRPLPIAALQLRQNTLTPSSSNSSLLTSDSMSLSFSSSNRSSLINMPDYDIPRRNPLPLRAVHNNTLQQQKLMGNNAAADLTPNISNLNLNSVTPTKEEKPQVVKTLELSLGAALDTLANLQSETTAAITKLLSFVSPEWRVRSNLEPIILDVKLSVVRLRTALHDLTEFSDGTLGNATQCDDQTLCQKLKPLVRALRDADKLIQESSGLLESQDWNLQNLAIEDKTICRPPDSLDQLIACAQTLTEDVRQSTSFIQGNALLLFKRDHNAKEKDDVIYSEILAPALRNNAAKNNASAEWIEDYDYVSFESKDEAARKNAELRAALPNEMKNNFDSALKAIENNAIESAACRQTGPQDCSVALSRKDKMLIRYYAVQLMTHMGNLNQAIDSFIETVQKNQPPKYFIAYGKFVVMSAYNLVTIGDIVHRNISQPNLSDRIISCTDALADALKKCVQSSKKAAAHFPSVAAVQEMVDSVWYIGELAVSLKASLLKAAQQTI